MTADTNKHVLGRKRPTFEITCGLSLYDNASSPILKMIGQVALSPHNASSWLGQKKFSMARKRLFGPDL